VSTTTISIGNTEGHYISKAQLATIQNAVDSLPLTHTPRDLSRSPSPTFIKTESAFDQLEIARLLAERENLSERARLTRNAIASSSGPGAIQFNLNLGELLSKIAKIDRVLKHYSQEQLRSQSSSSHA